MPLVSSTYWDGPPFDFRAPPKDAIATPVLLRTSDRREIRGVFWAPASEARVVAILMHPRVDFTRHYTIPRLIAGGIAVLACTSRHPNDDTDTVHEELLLDLAACVRHA